MPDHTWGPETWGHREVRTVQGLADRYVSLLRALYTIREQEGLSGAIYTQTTDVETEGNGLLTYDRVVCKIDPEVVAAANRGEFPRLQAAAPGNGGK